MGVWEAQRPLAGSQSTDYVAIAAQTERERLALLVGVVAAVAQGRQEMLTYETERVIPGAGVRHHAEYSRERHPQGPS